MTQEIQWGPAIAVDGKRPGFVKPTDLVHWSNNGKTSVTVEASQVVQWGDYDNRVTFHLPADHPYYRQTEATTPEGMKAWHGGDAAPADWDSEKPIAVDNNGSVELRYGWRWNWSREPVTACGCKLLRVIAYTPQPTPQADTKPDLTARMEALVRKIAEVGGEWDHGYHEWKEARAIVALLPEPVDEDLIEARKLALQNILWVNPEQRRAVEAGKQDHIPVIKLAYAALARGRALALAGEKEA